MLEMGKTEFKSQEKNKNWGLDKRNESNQTKESSERKKEKW